MKTKYKILIAIYVLGAIVTYGSAFKSVNSVIDKPEAMDGVAYIAGFESALWPLYWSQQIWK